MKSRPRVVVIFVLGCALLLVNLTRSGGMTEAGARFSLSPIRADTSAGGVLWDQTHGVYDGYDLSERYSSLVALLNGLGYTVDTTSAGLDNVPLSGYDVIVVSLASSYLSAYTPAEVAAIMDFVSDGGGLLVMGDRPFPMLDNDNINPVAGAFGSTCGVSDIDDIITDLLAGPLFRDVSRIELGRGGQITTTLPSTYAAFDNMGNAAVSTAFYGAGRVVVVGDFNLWDDLHINYADNRRFAENVFAWLVWDIEVEPAFFQFPTPRGQVFTDTLTITNLTGQVISWTIQTATGDTGVVGDWMFYFDWGCTGVPGVPLPALLTINADHTLEMNAVYFGTWAQTDNQVSGSMNDGTQFSGYVAGANMAGTMQDDFWNSGCWEASQVFTNSPARPSSDRALAGRRPSEAGPVFDLPGESWLTVDPVHGELANFDSFVVNLSVDTRWYVPGEHGLLILHSDGEGKALIAIPVSLDSILFLPVIVE